MIFALFDLPSSKSWSDGLLLARKRQSEVFPVLVTRARVLREQVRNERRTTSLDEQAIFALFPRSFFFPTTNPHSPAFTAPLFSTYLPLLFLPYLISSFPISPNPTTHILTSASLPSPRPSLLN